MYFSNIKILNNEHKKNEFLLGENLKFCVEAVVKNQIKSGMFVSVYTKLMAIVSLGLFLTMIQVDLRNLMLE